MSLSFLLIFAATVFSVSIIPSPSMLLALSHGMQYGLLTQYPLSSAIEYSIGLRAVIAFICFMLYGMIGHKLVALFSKAKIRQRINQLIGGGFISAGIGLASSNR
ncbi:MAG: hypothetical protein CMI12_00315 [Oceanospirillum sp.]|nr:hypothetical protein [Oceanospirillum sp.]